MTTKTAPAYTPGPWTFARATSERSDDRWAFGPGDTAGVGTVNGLANARLIAAAPEMVEALRTIARWADKRIDHIAIAEYARSLLQRIEGER